MKAAVASEKGLVLADIPKPEPAAGQVLVKVQAAGLNRADLSTARGAGGHGQALGAPVGIEFAGEVVACGSGVTQYKAGDVVAGRGNGTYAEFVAVDASQVWLLPSGMNAVEAAILPIALLTMHNAVVTVGGLKAGGSILVQGATSGVGLMAMKIARQRGAKLVLGTSTSAEKAAQLKAHGADAGLVSSNETWPDEVLKLTGGKGVDVIVDNVSGKTVNGSLKATAIKGTIVNVGRLGGTVAEMDFNLHAMRRINYIGVTFRTRSREEVDDIVARMQADLGAALKAGALTLPLDRTFPLDEAVAAHDYMRANKHFGKIALVMA